MIQVFRSPSGLLAALSGIVFSARMASGSPTLANEFLLPSIAAIVVGGTALTGGVGGVWQTYLGALIVSVLRIGMTFVGINVFAQQIVFGVVLIVAVAFTIDRSRIRVVK
jgi:ribose transport system permease protein